MDELKDIKENIYSVLTSVEYSVGEVTVYQYFPHKIYNSPSITFQVTDNSPYYAVDGDLNYQRVDIAVDFWADKPSTTTSMLKDAEKVLRENGYLLSSSRCLVEEDNTSHVNALFKFIV